MHPYICLLADTRRSSSVPMPLNAVQIAAASCPAMKVFNAMLSLVRAYAGTSHCLGSSLSRALLGYMPGQIRPLLRCMHLLSSMKQLAHMEYARRFNRTVQPEVEALKLQVTFAATSFPLLCQRSRGNKWMRMHHGLVFCLPA